MNPRANLLEVDWSLIITDVGALLVVISQLFQWWEFDGGFVIAVIRRPTSPRIILGFLVAGLVLALNHRLVSPNDTHADYWILSLGVLALAGTAVFLVSILQDPQKAPRMGIFLAMVGEGLIVGSRVDRVID